MPQLSFPKILRLGRRIALLGYLAASLPVITLVIWNPTCRSTILNSFAHYRGKIDPVRTVHIGDSITSGGGQWSLRLSGSPIDAYNLAENNCTVHQIRDQVPRALPYSPDAICVMAGTNDLFDERFDLEFTVSQFDQLLAEIAAKETPCIVTLIPYQSSPGLRLKITTLNSRISKLCHKYQCSLIDLNPHLAPEQKLLDQFTTDGVHLSENAYDIWAEEIRKALEESTP